MSCQAKWKNTRNTRKQPFARIDWRSFFRSIARTFRFNVVRTYSNVKVFLFDCEKTLVSEKVSSADEKSRKEKTNRNKVLTKSMSSSSDEVHRSSSSSSSHNNIKMQHETNENCPEHDTFICGVVEGFYGRPWTTGQRKELFGKLNRWGMDSYVYAPKDDYKVTFLVPHQMDA